MAGSSLRRQSNVVRRPKKKLSNFSLFCNLEQSSAHFAKSLNQTLFDREKQLHQKKPYRGPKFNSKSIFKRRAPVQAPKRKNLSIMMKKTQLLGEREDLQESEYLQDTPFMSEHSPERRNSQEKSQTVFKKEMFQVKSLRSFGKKKPKEKKRSQRGLRPRFWPKRIQPVGKHVLGELPRRVMRKPAPFFQPICVNIFDSEIFNKNKFISLNDNNLNHFYYQKKRRKSHLENVHSMPDNKLPSFMDNQKNKKPKMNPSNFTGQNTLFRDDNSENSLNVQKVSCLVSVTKDPQKVI